MFYNESVLVLFRGLLASLSCVGGTDCFVASNRELYLKGILHPKMLILSSFTHPQVVPNLYECLCSAEHKGRYFEESL